MGIKNYGDLPYVLKRTLELLRLNSTNAFVIKNFYKDSKERSKKLVSKDIRRLEIKGYIKKTTTRGLWQVTTVEEVLRHTTQGGDIRSHGYEFNIGIPIIKKWLEREEIFKKYNVNFKPIPQGQIIKVRRHNVYLYNKSIRVQFKRGTSFLSDDPDKGNQYAVIEFKETLRALQRKIKASINFGRSYKIKCHHAQLRNEIAQWHKDNGYTHFYIKDDKGEAWLMMDQSCNLLELETIHAKTSTNDMKQIVKPFMNKLRKNPYILQELEDLQLELLKNQLKQGDLVRQGMENSSKRDNNTTDIQEQLRANTMLLNKLTENVLSLSETIKNKF